MSLESVQYRSVIRFLFLKGKSREEIQIELSAIYGDECPSWATIKRWYNLFQLGRTSVMDAEKTGRPTEISKKINEKLESGKTINSAYYSKLVEQIRTLRRKSRVCDLYYLCDNAPIHTSTLSTRKIQHCGLKTLAHPPYSPDLVPSDFYLFNHLKKYLRGKKFDCKEELKEAVCSFFMEKSPIFFEKAFSDLTILWRKCINVGGNFLRNETFASR